MLLPLIVALQQPTAAPPDLLKRAHTYSIVAYDSASGDLGIAVQSKFPNVGGIVPWARAGVGAVATQSLGNTAYQRPAQRQVGMIDAHGNAASWTGDSCFDWAGGRTLGADGQIVLGGKGAMIVGRGFAAQANIMVSDQTVKNMADAFAGATGSLADRLMAALVAGQAGGGDKRGMESAALLVVRANGGYLGANDRYIDIRVYDDTNPIRELQRLYRLHQLYFFQSRPQDLVPITADIVRQLEPILLAEPVNQREKWLDAPQGTANAKFLQALENFMYWENYDVRVRTDGKIDRVALDDILARRRRRP
jgi:uncharacterized Ntn-hydrolase superfamily protein